MATYSLVASVGFLLGSLHGYMAENRTQACPNLGSIMDCGKQKLSEVPLHLPPWVQTLRLDSNSILQIPPSAFHGLPDLEELVLSNNKLKSLDTTAICQLPKLRVLKLSKNYLTQIPDLRRCQSLRELYLNSNNISQVDASSLGGLGQLHLLDLSKNALNHLGPNVFPAGSSIKHLNLADNAISVIDAEAFNGLSESLEKLRLGRNKLSNLPQGLFARIQLIDELDLSRNQFRHIDYTTFKDLGSLRNLSLKRNEIETLRDGSFFECKQLEILNLEGNKLGDLKVGPFFGLQSLKELLLAGNNISSIDAQIWEQAKTVTVLDLSRNSLRGLSRSSFTGLRTLKTLSVSKNNLHSIDDHALDGLVQLERLDLSSNQLSDGLQSSAQSVLGQLTRLAFLDLHANNINSISKKMFQGLAELKRLALRDNPITSVEEGSFGDLRQLIVLEMNSFKLVCDCKIAWLPAWVKAASFLSSVTGMCQEPVRVRGRRILDLAEGDFACEAHARSPLPVLTSWPSATVAALRYSSKALSCQATVGVAASVNSSADAAGDVGARLQLTVQWSKDGQSIQEGGNMQLRTEVRRDDSGTLTYSAFLRVANVTDDDEGRYQCGFLNEFGRVFSSKVELKVLVFPQFSVFPSSVKAKAEQDVSLKCAATGQPPPEISIQKDGGTNFPSARDRRFSFNQESNEFIIKKVRAEDAGVYYCVARNEAGMNVANATVDVIEPPRFVSSMECPRGELGRSAVLACPVDGSPRPRTTWLRDGMPFDPSTSNRHIFSSLATKLVITEARTSDAGAYTCQASNPLGKVEATCQLVVRDGSTEPEGVVGYDGTADGASAEEPLPPAMQQLDSTTITGIIVISVVCCVVGTSLVWVVIIYHMRRQRLRRGGQASTGRGDGSSSSSGAHTEETLLALPGAPASRSRPHSGSDGGYSAHSSDSRGHPALLSNYQLGCELTEEYQDESGWNDSQQPPVARRFLPYHNACSGVKSNRVGRGLSCAAKGGHWDEASSSMRSIAFENECDSEGRRGIGDEDFRTAAQPISTFQPRTSGFSMSSSLLMDGGQVAAGSSHPTAACSSSCCQCAADSCGQHRGGMQQYQLEGTGHDPCATSSQWLARRPLRSSPSELTSSIGAQSHFNCAESSPRSVQRVAALQDDVLSHFSSSTPREEEVTVARSSQMLPNLSEEISDHAQA